MNTIAATTLAAITFSAATSTTRPVAWQMREANPAAARLGSVITPVASSTLARGGGRP